MDPTSSVIVPAVVSAIVGTLTSFVAVPYATARQARANRAEAAKQSLAALVEPLALEVRQYRKGYPSVPRRDPDQACLPTTKLRLRSGEPLAIYLGSGVSVSGAGAGLCSATIGPTSRNWTRLTRLPSARR